MGLGMTSVDMYTSGRYLFNTPRALLTSLLAIPALALILYLILVTQLRTNEINAMARVDNQSIFILCTCVSLLKYGKIT